MKRRAVRMLRAGLGGVAATTVDVAVLVALVELAGMDAGMAASAGTLLGAVVSFTVAKLWAFGDGSPVTARQVVTFAFVAAVTATIAGVTVHVLHGHGMDYRLARLVAAVATFFCWGYPAQSRLAFRRARPA